MKSKILFLTFVFLLCTAAYVPAENPESIFYKANDLYGEGKYDEAIAEYIKLLSGGYASGNLYYNLGNTYFKKGDLGEAILYYERARRLMPRDGDLESNYKHARSLIEGNILTKRRMWLIRFVYNVFDQYTINEITLLLSMSYLFITGTLIIVVFLKMTRARAIILSVLIVILVLASLSLHRKITLLEKEAIVVAESAEAKFEPFERATTHFTLYGGMKVQAISLKGDWYKIERADGKIGWIKAAELEKI